MCTNMLKVSCYLCINFDQAFTSLFYKSYFAGVVAPPPPYMLLLDCWGNNDDSFLSQTWNTLEAGGVQIRLLKMTTDEKQRRATRGLKQKMRERGSGIPVQRNFLLFWRENCYFLSSKMLNIIKRWAILEQNITI